MTGTATSLQFPEQPGQTCPETLLWLFPPPAALALGSHVVDSHPSSMSLTNVTFPRLVDLYYLFSSIIQ